MFPEMLILPINPSIQYIQNFSGNRHLTYFLTENSFFLYFGKKSYESQEKESFHKTLFPFLKESKR